MPITNKKVSRRPLYKAVRRHAKMAIIPHASNQFRPHLIRHYGIITVLLVVIAVQFIGNSSLTQVVLGDKAQITPKELLDQTNNARASEGLTALVLDEKLSNAAYLKANDMIARQYWAHNAPDGTQPWKWYSDVGYNYSYAGENLAKNFSSSQSVISAWLNSQTHRENILKSQYRDVGFATIDGTLDGKPASFVVAMYGTPMTAAVQGVSAAAPVTALGSPLGPLSQLGFAVQSVNPAVIGSAIILMFTAAVAMAAHAYRNKLPRTLQRSWYRHHGIYKAIGLTSVVFVIIAIYGSSGQI